MSNRRPVLRLFIRKQLQRADVDRAALRRAMWDDDVLDTVSDEVVTMQAVPRDGMKFLDWLLEHADEILALIMKIIALFPAEAELSEAVGELRIGEGLFSLPSKIRLSGKFTDEGEFDLTIDCE